MASYEQAICPNCRSGQAAFSPYNGELWCPDCGFHSGPPEQCYRCGELIDGDAAEIVVDLDPGDPEVGPAPDVQHVLIHAECLKPGEQVA